MGEISLLDAADEARKIQPIAEALVKSGAIIDKALQLEAERANAEATVAKLRKSAEKLAADTAEARAAAEKELAELAKATDAKKGDVAQAKKKADEIVAAAREDAAKIKAEAEAIAAAGVKQANQNANDAEARETAASARGAELDKAIAKKQGELDALVSQIEDAKRDMRTKLGL